MVHVCRFKYSKFVLGMDIETNYKQIVFHQFILSYLSAVMSWKIVVWWKLYYRYVDLLNIKEEIKSGFRCQLVSP